jgi:hypothetical protein
MGNTVQLNAFVPPEKYFGVNSGVAIRPMNAAYVGAWTELWLGLRFRMTPTYLDTDLFDDGLLFSVGLCNGAKAWNHNVNIDHLVGVFSPISLFVDLAQSGGLWYAAGAWTWRVIVGGVPTSGVGYTANNSADPSARSLMMMRYVRGAPNWTLETFYPDPAAAVTDVSDAKFANLMNQPTWAGVLANKPANYQTTFPLVTTLAVDEADGALDSFYVSWNKTYSTCEISEVLISTLPRVTTYSCE